MLKYAARLAALEAFAAAFADAEWMTDPGDESFLCCWTCGGMRPVDYDEREVAGPPDVTPRNADRARAENARCGRGHAPDCTIGQAVARVKETA